MRHKLLVPKLALFALIITACSTAFSVEPEPVGNPERGQEVYEDRNRTRCTQCHTLDGSNIRGGPSLLGISERAGDRKPEMSAVDYLQQSLLDPSAYIVEGFEDKMKMYQVVDPDEVDFLLPGMLTQEELDDLTAFLLTQ
jgi:cytochrome c2